MNKKEKKAIFVFLLIIIFVVILILILTKNPFSNKQKIINGYPKDYYNRPNPDYTMSLKEINGSVEVYSINFTSKNFMDSSELIYGLFFLPKDKENIPGIVLLPGGAVTKESFIKRSIDLANSGYAVLVIDQRGIGETGGYYPSYENDYQIFASGKEPVQHLGVYDALVASDVLRDIKAVDEENIAIIGESMGGRYAIIATALDERLKGVIIISSSGFHFENDSQPYVEYLFSIDPDKYINQISPRPIFMLQGDNDSIVKIEDAFYTFNLANQPKKFFKAEGCRHGYCDKMSSELMQNIKTLFEK